MALPLDVLPSQLVVFPPGTYRISLDLITRDLSDGSPDDCEVKARADVHKRIGTTLQIYGFVEHAQGSVYQALNTTALLCWFAVQYLKADTELASSIRSIQISYIHHVFHIHRVDCSDLLRLGGAHSPQLLGPTPRGLIPNNVQANPIADPSTLPLDYCKVTSASTDPDNWRT